MSGSGRLRIGACSWNFPSWKGVVYDAERRGKRPSGAELLAEYARRYDTVEVDRWFWSLFGPDRPRLPDPADVEAYRRAVPEDFRFTLKGPNSVTLTHFYRKEKGEPLRPNPRFLSAETAAEFLALLEPIRALCGPVFFQFEYLNKQKMEGAARFRELFGAFRKDLPGGWIYGLETRNPRWIDRSFAEWIAAERIVPVFIDGYWMPPLEETIERFGPSAEEAGTVVIRLLGPDRKEIEKRTGGRWDRIVAPKDDGLDRLVRIVASFLEGGVDVYLNVNNHYEGSAPLTIERFRERLGAARGE